MSGRGGRGEGAGAGGGYGGRGEGRGRGGGGYGGDVVPPAPNPSGPPKMIPSAAIMPADAAEELRKQLQTKLTLGASSSSSAPEGGPAPASSKLVMLNHFLVDVSDKDLTPYDHESERESNVAPQNGAWNMINKKMVNGARVDNWDCICFFGMQLEMVGEFCCELIAMCNSKGMAFNPKPTVPTISAQLNHIESALKHIHKQSQNLRKQIQLLIVILPDVSGSYGLIKRVCETELGIVSQCCQPKQAEEMNKQYLKNVNLKINVKVGRRNTVLHNALLRRIPNVIDHKTIIFGADVTHPQPGEDSSLSIAAVAASMDWPEVTKYKVIVSAQKHRQEIIEDLYKSSTNEKGELVHSGIIRELLCAFRRATNLVPKRIIFYRDGFSEGQFSQILRHEMDAIRKACQSLRPDYLPAVTFVVVQKRHHTCLFACDHDKQNEMDRSGNILPGTVVDTHICHPTESDFYLRSHAGIQGTSGPTHYHVLCDENKFTADELQSLTNNLCCTCTRPVSIVPPVYYAHLAAFRGRCYVEGDNSDAASTIGGTGQLPAVKENVKDVMFYS